MRPVLEAAAAKGDAEGVREVGLEVGAVLLQLYGIFRQVGGLVECGWRNITGWGSPPLLEIRVG
jgi:hypothetical protein